MRMPHERDESATHGAHEEQLEPVQAEKMEQARRDVESEQQDTDCHGQPAAQDSDCPAPPAGSRSA
jgi:hypothetical protein